ncbi:MAG: response regulator [Desulfuromonadales bacterium]|nr:response regulator [Desulfuromonadales bacterium]
MNRHIAIIDDDQSIRHFLSEFLILKGFTVDSYASAEEALPKLKGGEYDLIIFDVVLPGLSGIEACSALRKESATRKTPVILISAINRSAEQVREAKEVYGASIYLLKPFSLETLHQKIVYLLDGDEPIEEPAHGKSTRIEGDLLITPFPELLRDLYTLQRTGLLHLNQAERKKAIYFKSGYPIFVRSNLVRECLGNILAIKELISKRECEESLQIVRETGKMQGEVLVEMKLLKPEQLPEVLRVQATEKLLEIFTWQRGAFHFSPAVSFKQNVTHIDLSPANIILQGIRNNYNEAKVDQLLEPYLKSFPALSNNPHYRFQDVELIQREAKILAECNGRDSCEQILDRYPLSRFENKRLLASLLLVKLLEGHKRQLAPKERSSLFATSPQETKKREAFIKTFDRMMNQNFFDLLGLKTDTTDEEIRRSYVVLAKRFHPDHLQQEQLSSDLKQQANSLFQRIGEAYNTLSNKEKRQRYLLELQGGKREDRDEAKIIIEAENAFQRGVVLLNNNNFTQAHKELEKAVNLYQEEPEYLCYLGWAKFKSAAGDAIMLEQAKELIQKSIRLNPNLDKGHLFHGYMLKEGGRLPEAEKKFERAIQCNRKCTEALRELRLINLRSTSGNDASVLGKLFKK